MNVIVISDTHGLHHQLNLPDGDILLHAGDVSVKGSKAQIVDFLNWFSQQPHPYKIFIAGNHDFYFERHSSKVISALIPDNILYLNEEGATINQLKIWGSPVTPPPNTGKRWAFNRERGAKIQEHWDLIPKNLDILIVHGPPIGKLDKILKGQHVGCQNLQDTIHQNKPKLCIFGHIHESRGLEQIHTPYYKSNTLYVNASSVDRYKTKIFPPFVFEWENNQFIFNPLNLLEALVQHLGDYPLKMKTVVASNSFSNDLQWYQYIQKEWGLTKQDALLLIIVHYLEESWKKNKTATHSSYSWEICSVSIKAYYEKQGNDAFDAFYLVLKVNKDTICYKESLHIGSLSNYFMESYPALWLKFPELIQLFEKLIPQMIPLIEQKGGHNSITTT